MCQPRGPVGGATHGVGDTEMSAARPCHKWHWKKGEEQRTTVPCAQQPGGDLLTTGLCLEGWTWDSSPGGRSLQADAGRWGGGRGREWTTRVVPGGHWTVGMWVLPAMRLEAKGALGRALNATSMAAGWREGGVSRAPTGHGIVAAS